MRVRVTIIIHIPHCNTYVSVKLNGDSGNREPSHSGHHQFGCWIFDTISGLKFGQVHELPYHWWFLLKTSVFQMPVAQGVQPRMQLPAEVPRL